MNHTLTEILIICSQAFLENMAYWGLILPAASTYLFYKFYFVATPQLTQVLFKLKLDLDLKIKLHSLYLIIITTSNQNKGI